MSSAATTQQGKLIMQIGNIMEAWLAKTLRETGKASRVDAPRLAKEMIESALASKAKNQRAKP